MISSIGKITEASTVVAAGAPHTLAPELRIVVGMPAGKLTSLHKEDLDPNSRTARPISRIAESITINAINIYVNAKVIQKVQKLL